ncbi:hypothetical protein Pla175_10550 [Pirellulimonas nuda]|uniref:Uncharacterized protein n=1 Tax=Pirellulimonas nuda TaxID=2528009 RepID=A0A518D881_9BACT|nr:hypothetical protein [Pirellulimonas nuda]QDU87689.1 hypothetical protein Pla175_10550 [Pirellulimonas nuda]
MARAYARTLGTLGMAVTLLRAAASGAGVEEAMTQALAALAGLAAVGLVVGWIAQATIDESVRQRLEAELAETQPAT